jgi:transposase-like protein
VAESYGELESVCAVARRYGLAQGQLFTWLHEARMAMARVEKSLVPVVEECEPAAADRLAPKRSRRRSGRGGIEVELDGVAVRVERVPPFGRASLNDAPRRADYRAPRRVTRRWLLLIAQLRE